jgi:hypothetical protein
MAKADATDESIVQHLAASDTAYFAAGARRSAIPGGTIHWLPGLQHLAIGCIVELGDDTRLRAAPSAWAASVAPVLKELGATSLRFYTQDPNDCHAALERAGLKPVTELAFACAVPAPADPAWFADGAEIAEATSAADWADKQRLAEQMAGSLYGKEVPAEAWTRMERRKVEAGYMSCWLVRMDGEVCGSFGLAERRPLLRLKNVLVGPKHRRRGLARTMVAFGLSEAWRRKLHFGCYAFPGEVGAHLYASCGMSIVGSQTEWTAPLAQMLHAAGVPQTLAAAPC